MMLGKEIQQFISEIKQLNGVGCLLVPRSSLEKLVSLLNKADVIVRPTVVPGIVTYHVVKKDVKLPRITPPTLLIVTEEDYSSDPKFEEKIRDVAAYFMNVK